MSTRRRFRPRSHRRFTAKARTAAQKFAEHAIEEDEIRELIPLARRSQSPWQSTLPGVTTAQTKHGRRLYRVAVLGHPRPPERPAPIFAPRAAFHARVISIGPRPAPPTPSKKPKPSETYATARKRLHAELEAKGWKASPPSLKVPWAESLGERISFKPQAVYLNAHSLGLDMRGLSVDALIAAAHRR